MPEVSSRVNLISGMSFRSRVFDFSSFRFLLIVAVVFALEFSSYGVLELSAQVYDSPVAEEGELPLDTLERRSEWWLGIQGSAFYAKNFGTLTVEMVGGTAPDQPAFSVTPQGGYGYGVGGGLALEFRPIHSMLGFLLTSSMDYRWSQSETIVPIKDDIFAYNAVFESQSNVLYLATALSVKAQLGVTGSFAIVGVTYDYPVQTVQSFVWQHEVWEGEEPTNLPGAPQTSIKFNTTVKYEPRFGLQIGVGHDFQAGFFGYKGQLVTPYFVIQGGTPIVSAPTSFNSVFARLGFIWRGGL